MYQLTIEPYTYPVSRREAETQLFKAIGRSKRAEAPTEAELAQVNLVEPMTFAKPTVPAGKVAVKDSRPTLKGSTWGFDWKLVDLPTAAEELAREREQMVCSRAQGKMVIGAETWASVEALADDPDTPWALKCAILDTNDWRRE